LLARTRLPGPSEGEAVLKSRAARRALRMVNLGRIA
jgi:hypothetical protein